MRKITLTEIDLDELYTSFRSIIREEIKAGKTSELQEKFLSPADTCKLFQPNISKVTLSAWTKESLLKDYRISGRVYYKYSDVMEAVKHLSKYKRPVASHN